MSKRRPLVEEDVLRIIRRDGRFCLNPLMWRHAGRVKLLESMRKRGVLRKRSYKLNYVEYTLKENAHE